MRLVKDETELGRIRKAVDISVEAHMAAMQTVRPGIYEYELESLIDSIYRRTAVQGPHFSR